MRMRLRSLLVPVVWVALGTINIAQCQPTESASPEKLLGSSEDSLVNGIPGLTRVAKPMRGPGNSRGKWWLQEVQLAAQPYSATFFVKSGQVTGIEYLSTAPAQECRQLIPFESAKSELSKSYGESRIIGKFENGGRLSQSTSFLGSDVAVTLHVSVLADTCSTRVIYKIADLKDASEL